MAVFGRESEIREKSQRKTGAIIHTVHQSMASILKDNSNYPKYGVSWGS